MSKRQELLEEAIKITTGPRNTSYGTPEDNFKRIGELWGWYLDNITYDALIPHDVAIMMILMKIARLTHDPHHRDSWLDIAGYAACGWETVREGG